MSKNFREIEVRGHLIDSLILTKIFDVVMDLGGEFEVKEIKIGKKKKDESYAKLRIYGKNQKELEKILELVYREGATAKIQKEIQLKIQKSKGELADVLKLEKEHSEIKAKILKARKELEFTESQIYASNNRDAPKSIIEAASTMMASVNSELRRTQQELEAVKKTLELERKANKKSE